MVYTVDIGNSNIVTVLYDLDGNRISDMRKETIKEKNEERFYELFKNSSNIMEKTPTAVVLSCVVPNVEKTAKKVLEEIFDCEIISLNVGLIGDINIHLENPNELGSDLLATSYGVLASYKKPAIVADLGSANKLTVIGEKGDFLGGVLMQGIGFTAKSLHNMIPHLPNIPIERPQKILGNNTVECIQSGIINGALCSIVELCNKIENELGYKCLRVLTGGYSKLFVDLDGFIYDEFLLNDGLFEVYRRYISRKIKV